MASHTAHRPLHCAVCGRGFHQTEDLKRHIRLENYFLYLSEITLYLYTVIFFFFCFFYSLLNCWWYVWPLPVPSHHYHSLQTWYLSHTLILPLGRPAWYPFNRIDWTWFTHFNGTYSHLEEGNFMAVWSQDWFFWEFFYPHHKTCNILLRQLRVPWKVLHILSKISLYSVQKRQYSILHFIIRNFLLPWRDYKPTCLCSIILSVEPVWYA